MKGDGKQKKERGDGKWKPDLMASTLPHPQG